MNVLGERIKYLRKQAGLNQIELANALNREYGLKIDRCRVLGIPKLPLREI